MFSLVFYVVSGYPQRSLYVFGTNGNLGGGADNALAAAAAITAAVLRPTLAAQGNEKHT